jgi:hypothetical protein
MSIERPPEEAKLGVFLRSEGGDLLRAGRHSPEISTDVTDAEAEDQDQRGSDHSQHDI